MKLNVIFTRHALSDDMKLAMRADVTTLDMSDLAAVEIQDLSDASELCERIENRIAVHWSLLRNTEVETVTSALVDTEDYQLALFDDIHMYGVFPAILVAELYHQYNIGDPGLPRDTAFWNSVTVSLFGFWNGKRASATTNESETTFEFKAWVKFAIINAETADLFALGGPSLRKPQTAELEVTE